MQILTKSDILADREDIPFEVVEVPEWGGAVRVRGLTAAERDRYEASLVKLSKRGDVQQTSENAKGRLAALGICDERGGRIFSDDDARSLGDKSAKALSRVCDVIARLSGMDRDALETAKGN